MPQPWFRKNSGGPHQPGLGPSLEIWKGTVREGSGGLTRLDISTGYVGQDEHEGWMWCKQTWIDGSCWGGCARNTQIYVACQCLCTTWLG